MPASKRARTRGRPDETEKEEIRLERSAPISPTGVAGSELRVRIENRLSLVIAPTGV